MTTRHFTANPDRKTPVTDIWGPYSAWPRASVRHPEPEKRGAGHAA